MEATKIKTNYGYIVYGRETETYETPYAEKKVEYKFKKNDNDYCINGLSMEKNYNFRFYADVSEEFAKKENQVNFIIERNNPLYTPLLNFLYDKKSFLLDDDNETQYNNKKTMEIINNEENIEIIFKNTTGKEELPDEKFSVFIKNIFFDEKSKLDKNGVGTNNTKAKLAILFNEFDKVLSPKKYDKSLEEENEER